MTEHIYEDRWGDVLDRPGADLVELRWFDTTEEMSAQDFKDALATFAGCIEKCGRTRVLIDGTSFLMRPEDMDGPWRDAHIIPRYNAAGVRRFAFHMPAGMPMIGATPAPEEPGQFPTGYFGRRRDALAWLAQDDGGIPGDDDA
jgi:hypothetical protein